jgi:ribosomal-protein-alanine N-acetyltransferase
MSHDDLEEVWEIERHSFSSPWTIPQFISELNNDFSHIYTAKVKSAGTSPELAEGEVIVVGYAVFWSVSGEAHFLKITVHPHYRCQGIGGRLLKFSLKRCQDAGMKVALLEVRASNTTAQQFYKRFGFREVGVRKGYYPDNKENAILLTLKI